MNERLADAKDRVRINGFRPGKVPISHLKKMYGKSIMAELVNEIIREKPTEILTERGEKAATQPEITMTEDEAEANEDPRGQCGFRVLARLRGHSADRAQGQQQDRGRPAPSTTCPAEEVEEQVRRIAENARSYETKEGKAEKGDRVTIDFVGKIDGEEFEGGKAEDAQLVIGSNTFIPGFEDQLRRRCGRRRQDGHRHLPRGLRRSLACRQGSRLRRQGEGRRQRRRDRDQRRTGREARRRVAPTSCARSSAARSRASTAR